MTKTDNNTLFWGFGLSDIECKKIESSAPGYRVRNFNASALPTDNEMEGETPFLIWIPGRVWVTLDDGFKSAILEWDPAQKVLLADARDDLDVERLLDLGFLSILRTPLAASKVQETLYRAREVHALYEDIVRMTREIALEREILSRKTDYLLFLNKFMARASESLNPATILTQARRDLCSLFAVSAVQGIFWADSDEEFVESEIFLTFQEDADIQEQWIEKLMENAARLSNIKVNSYQLTYLMDAEAKVAPPLEPGTDRAIMLPLKAGGKDFGTLALLTPTPVRLTKQQRDVLHSAVNHLGLALKNALLFREVKLKADHDGLTRIFNRQFFDNRFMEEMRRSTRYGQDISLMMLDLDHFKNINDTHGHQAGDLVLKEIGSLLMESLRTTDFAARYGGEEFAVILPHTGEEQAWLLAERLRRKVEKLNLKHDGKVLSVTTSIGVASLSATSFSRNPDLIKAADRALYLAKASGRNMVCTSDGCDDYSALLQEQQAGT
ncbi:MAG: sensor domain-containing diguanylate cyclase [Proteobacteria bacterium]|nr:sensor domain-containing diguanylate cyclase [Pseudomonadota bacterium]